MFGGYSLTLTILLCVIAIWGVGAHKNKPDKNNDYKSQTIRRQQVIHPIDDDKTTSKNDDDIEQYGKTMDASGAVINKPTPHKPEAVNPNTKDIIAKIKEIQDKIFKRTGDNKVLEDKLRLMSPMPVQKNVVQPKAVDVNGDRRKIIPEDVVDKILQKFQQLRSEAKNIALASAPEAEKTKEATATKEKSSSSEVSIEPVSPYASIEPPKESVELMNRTHNDDVTSIGVPPPMESTPGENRNLPGPSGQLLTDPNTGDIQIPIGNSASEAGSVPIINAKSAPGVPIMFIKNGPNLIPVFNNPGAGGRPGRAAPVSIANEASVQYNTNHPPAPNMPNNVVPMTSSFDGGQFNNGQFNGGQEVPYDNDRVTDSRTTSELIDRLIHTPGFPQLASKLMSEGRVNYDEQRLPSPEAGDSRNIVPMSDHNVEGLNPAMVNFNMKNNFANDFPGQPSMLQGDDSSRSAEHSEEIQKFLENQPRSKPDMADDNPFQHQHGGFNNNKRYGDRSYVNDISDPIDDLEPKYKTKSADELLDYAKYRSMISPDSHTPPGSQVGVQPPSEKDLEAVQRSQYLGERRDRENSEDKHYERFMSEDPSSLLDELHKSQIHGGLTASAPPPDNSLRPEEEMDEEGHERHHIPIEPAPDDLMEQLLNFNHRMQDRQLQHRRELQFNSRHIDQGFGQMDPSIADEIRGGGGLMQQFDVERKDLATENDMQLLKSRSPGASSMRRHGPISVMSDDTVQFKTGRVSMDSNDAINSYNKESAFSRNKIGRPRHHRKHKRRFLHPYTRGIIEKPMPLGNDVELRVNGQALTDNIQLRSSIIDGKVKPGKGKTLVSKEPVQIELSHGNNKRKIINIVTKGKYNVINEKKRHKIPHQQDNLEKLNII